jgi:hypothetical protein
MCLRGMEMRVKLRNHQNINTTNPTRKETRFPFHYHVTSRVCPTAKSSHRAKIVSRGMLGRIIENQKSSDFVKA